MIKLTSYETGTAVYVDETQIVSVKTIPASEDHRERTQIQTTFGITLVHETPDDVITAPPLK